MGSLLRSVGAISINQAKRMAVVYTTWSRKVPGFPIPRALFPQVSTRTGPLVRDLQTMQSQPQIPPVSYGRLFAHSYLQRMSCWRLYPMVHFNTRSLHHRFGRTRLMALKTRVTQPSTVSTDWENRRSFHHEDKNHEEETRETFIDKYALWSILSVNVVVFCMWQNLSWRRFMAKNFAISTAAVTQEGRFHTIITSFFSHYDWVHLGANMCCLWFFGSETLRILGGRKFLALYVGGGGGREGGG